MFIVCQDYILQISIDLMKENRFTLKKARSRWYLAESIIDTDYAHDIALLASNTSTQAESQLNCLEQAAGDIGLHVNADKTEYMCFNLKGDNSTLNGGSLKSVDKVTYLSSSISSTESDINMRPGKAIGYWSYGSLTYLIK